MKNWPIGKRITFGFVVIILLAIALGGFTWLSSQLVQKNFQQVATVESPIQQILGRVETRVNSNQASLYKHIYSPNAQDMDALEAQMAANTKANSDEYETLKGLLYHEDDQKEWARYQELTKAYRELRISLLKESRASTTPEASAKVCAQARAEFDPLCNAMLGSLEKILARSNQAVATMSENTEKAIQSLRFGVLIATGLVLLIGSGLAFFITRNTNKALVSIASELGEASDQVASAAAQVSSSSQTLAKDASEQAASLEETSASLEEISSQTARNAEAAGNARQLAEESSQAMATGTEQMNQMVAAMEEIKTASNNIAQIIKTIDEIAFQTNILALNASVEAARAGEAGAGFAVVADEVRNLAQRSAQAAKETTEKIEDSIGKSSKGAELSHRVAEGLTQIAEKNHKLNTLVGEIATASQEQRQGLGQVNTAITQMDKVTQANASGAEESASASEELSAQSLTMKENVGKLLLLVGSGDKKS